MTADLLHRQIGGGEQFLCPFAKNLTADAVWGLVECGLEQGVQPRFTHPTIRGNLPHRHIRIATLAGQKTEIDLKNIYVRNVRIIGSTLRSRTPETKAKILADLVSKVWPKVATGEVKPTIYKVLPIQEAEAAHDILYKGQNVGKVVLTVG